MEISDFECATKKGLPLDGSTYIPLEMQNKNDSKSVFLATPQVFVFALGCMVWDILTNF
jgi:hypothetical protein